MSKPFVNPKEFELHANIFHKTTEVSKDERIDSSFRYVKNMMSPDEVVELKKHMGNSEWIPVGVNGMKGDYVEGDPIGSWRMSSFQEDYTKVLFERIADSIDLEKHCDDSTNTDWDGTPVWEAIGINPLLRFIKYKDGGYLVPHYDAPYIANHDERTLASVVIYLDDNPLWTCLDNGLNESFPTAEGGETRFLYDDQASIPVAQRDLEDKESPAEEHEVLCSITPTPGDAIIFDHRILHESKKFHALRGDAEKNIIRTDIMYRRAS